MISGGNIFNYFPVNTKSSAVYTYLSFTCETKRTFAPFANGRGSSPLVYWPTCMPTVTFGSVL